MPRVVAALLLVVGFALACGGGAEGGVRLPHDMDAYAVEYIDQHGLLEPGEELLAYYDTTILLSGTESAMVTDRRLVYHKEGLTTGYPLSEIVDVSHTYESMIGDVITIRTADGRYMRVEIAPFNDGDLFVRVLMDAWAAARG